MPEALPPEMLRFLNLLTYSLPSGIVGRRGSPELLLRATRDFRAKNRNRDTSGPKK
jgi:hypothetical protein